MEIDKELFDIQDPDSPVTLTDILNETLGAHDTVSLDGAIFPIKQCEALKARLSDKNIKVDINLEDRLIMDEGIDYKWASGDVKEIKVYGAKDQRGPIEKVRQVFEMSDFYTPELQKSLKSQGVDAIFVSKVEEVNWLLNLRAIGVHFNDPMFNGFALAIHN